MNADGRQVNAGGTILEERNGLEATTRSRRYFEVAADKNVRRPDLCWRRKSRQIASMSSLVQVAIHPSQFPENVICDLLASLRSRQVNHKFHYDSVKQARKWLAVHQAFSPSRTDADCAAIYDESFGAVARHMRADRVHLLGLGAGGGQKDARLLRLLQRAGRELFYTPCDVSVALALEARQRAVSVIAETHCTPLVCDLASPEDPTAALGELSGGAGAIEKSGAARLITFFGMLPNFEPEVILPRLASLVRSGDYLLVSANLAPGSDYAAGVQKILPLYDNAPTRDWLLVFLLDLGVERADGEMEFRVESDPGGRPLKRVAAHFRFSRAREMEVSGERFVFAPGESLRLFFSYRHTPGLVRSMLGQHGLTVKEQWVAKSGEEGVFLVARE
jgi:uncharacterized SAM-dependent methyltransferase